MAIEGRIVTLNASSYGTPPSCCSCGAPQETQLETSHMQQAGRVRTTLRMRFPYCNACAARAKDFHSKLVASYLAAIGAALLVGGLVFAATLLPLVAAIVVALVLGAGVAVGAVLGMQPKAPPPPATCRGEAARIVSFNGNIAQVTLTNPGWAEAFARGNNVQLQPRTVKEPFAVGPIVTAVILAPIAGLASWLIGHPTVYADNGTPEPIQIYVDGKKEVVVPAGDHVSMDIGHGTHAFGWSKEGAAAPVSTTEGDVQVGDEHLYNPDKTACYWLVADIYGSASTDGIEEGAQPLQEFYRFDKVDTWFGENPESVQVKGDGATRIAIQRAKSCMQLVERGCTLSAREALVTCQRAAKSDVDLDRCFDQAVAGCKSGGSAAKPGAAAKPAQPKKK